MKLTHPRVCTTPGKPLEFYNFLSGPWKTPLTPHIILISPQQVDLFQNTLLTFKGTIIFILVVYSCGPIVTRLTVSN